MVTRDSGSTGDGTCVWPLKTSILCRPLTSVGNAIPCVPLNFLLNSSIISWGQLGVVSAIRSIVSRTWHKIVSALVRSSRGKLNSIDILEEIFEYLVKFEVGIHVIIYQISYILFVFH